MKIGIMSDTHGMVEKAKKIIENEKDIDLWIHLGDHYKDALFLEEDINTKIIALKGNCDRYMEGIEEKVLTIENFKIFLTHGHYYDVNDSLTRLYYKALELQCDIVLFGHTHIPMNIRHDGILIINPGSLSRPRGGSKASYGVIQIENDKVYSDVVEV